MADATIDQFNADQSKQLADYSTQSKSAADSFYGGQAQQQGDLLGRYTSTLNAQPTQQDLYKQIGGQYNLDNLRGLMNTANQTITDLPRNQLTFAQQGNGGGGFNANQLQQAVQQKLYDLAPIAQRATQQFQNASDAVNTQMGFAEADQQRALQPFQLESSMLSDRLAREATGFQTAQQNELTSLLTKLQNGATLTNGELQRAHDLSLQEIQFNQQKQLAGMSAGNLSSQAAKQQQYDLTKINAQSQANMNEYNNTFKPPTTPIGSSSSRPPLSDFGSPATAADYTGTGY